MKAHTLPIFDVHFNMSLQLNEASHMHLSTKEQGSEEQSEMVK